MTRDDARLAEPRHLSRRARAIAEAHDAREIAGPDDRHETSASDFIGATAIFALLFAAGVVIREGLLIWGLL